MRSTLRSSEQYRARNAENVAKTCERFVYPIAKITRLHDIKHDRHIFLEKFMRYTKVSIYFVIVLFKC